MIINIARVESFKKTPEKTRKEIDQMVENVPNPYRKMKTGSAKSHSEKSGRSRKKTDKSKESKQSAKFSNKAKSAKHSNRALSEKMSNKAKSARGTTKSAKKKDKKPKQKNQFIDEEYLATPRLSLSSEQNRAIEEKKNALELPQHPNLSKRTDSKQSNKSSKRSLRVEIDVSKAMRKSQQEQVRTSNQEDIKKSNYQYEHISEIDKQEKKIEQVEAEVQQTPKQSDVKPVTDE